MSSQAKRNRLVIIQGDFLAAPPPRMAKYIFAIYLALHEEGGRGS